MSLSDRLRYARERTGLTGSQVRERTGIGDSSLSEFENDKREPSLAQLQKLARVYRRPLSFFLSDESIPEEAAVMWREEPENSKEIEARFLQFCEQYHNLEMWTGEKAHLVLPDITPGNGSFGYREATDLSLQVGRQLSLGERPGRSLLTVLEEVCGVKVLHESFQPTGNAACARSDSFGGAILLNTGSPRWRRNHDLAHELFHLITWNLFHEVTDAGILRPSIDEEKLATCFAANLLMPGETFRSAIERRAKDGKVAYPDLYDVAREFDVSIESVIWRIHYVYDRGPSRSEETRSQIDAVKEYAALYEERGEESLPDKYPDRYRALAVKALRNGDMSVGKFAEYLEISRQHAMKYLRREEAGVEEIAFATS
jgi:Zn-dependent peptidase ImmA (M78 family)/transcriptional regulator with XRE-family HTH domain